MKTFYANKVILSATRLCHHLTCLPQQSPPPASPVILHEDPNLGKVELEKMEMEELDIPLPANTEESILIGGGLAPHYMKYTCFLLVMYGRGCSGELVSVILLILCLPPHPSRVLEKN